MPGPSSPALATKMKRITRRSVFSPFQGTNFHSEYTFGPWWLSQVKGFEVWESYLPSTPHKLAGALNPMIPWYREPSTRNCSEMNEHWYIYIIIYVYIYIYVPCMQVQSKTDGSPCVLCHFDTSHQMQTRFFDNLSEQNEPYVETTSRLLTVTFPWNAMRRSFNQFTIDELNWCSFTMTFDLGVSKMRH